MTWTQAQCDQVFETEVNLFWKGVHAATHDCYSTENQLGAMLSLAFNIGLGGFQTSSVLRHHRAKDYRLAADSFLLWVKDNGVFVQGLYNRRVVERNLYLSPAYGANT
jgi:lysozyme